MIYSKNAAFRDTSNHQVLIMYFYGVSYFFSELVQDLFEDIF